MRNLLFAILAGAAVFGILFATVITLFLVPGIYLILEDVKGIGPMLRARKERRIEST